SRGASGEYRARFDAGRRDALCVLRQDASGCFRCEGASPARRLDSASDRPWRRRADRPSLREGIGPVKRRCILAVVLGLGLAPTAQAATHRIAVLAGNNAGSGARPPLHFAETDAGKMARVLAELAGVQPSDLFLLQGEPLSGLHEAMRSARA